MNRNEGEPKNNTTLKKVAKHIGEVTLAASVLAGAATAASATETNPVDGATIRTYNCSTTVDKWVEIYPNEITVIKASAVIVPGDKDVNGVVQTDNLAETNTALGLKTKDNTNKNWVLGNKYGASAWVLKCGSSFSRFYSALGKRVYAADQRNNPDKSVQVNIITQ